MSDADRVNLSYFEESTFGLDTAPGTKKAIRFTGESLKQTTGSSNSAEIRDDRQTADVVRTSIGADGDVNIEFSAETFDDFLEAGLLSADWTAQVNITDTTYAAATTGNKYTDSAAGFVSDGFVVGQILRVAGYTDPANNGFARVVSVTTTDLVVDLLTLVTEAAGAAITFNQLGEIVNGTEQRSFGIEREYADLSTNFAYYNGMEVNTLNLALASDAIITGTVGFMGIKEDSRSSLTGGAVPAKNENEVLSSVDDIDGVFNDGLDECTVAFTMDINNNLRSRKCIGKLDTDSIGTGQFNVTGTFQKYYESAVLIDKYLSFTDADLAFVVQDEDGNGYVFWMPRVKYSSGQRVAGGQNSDILADMAYSAFRDDVLGFTLKIARFIAP